MAQVYPQATPVQLPLFVFEKQCTHCHETKPAAAFSRASARRDGRCSWCKQCEQRQRDERRGTPTMRRQNRDLVPRGLKWCGACRTIKALAQFYPQPRGAYGLRCECKLCSRAKAMKRYWVKTSDPVFRANNCMRARAWRRLNPVRKRQRDHLYYTLHRAEFIARTRAWAATNPDKAAALAHRTHARRRALRRRATGSHTYLDLCLIKEAQRGRCAYCGLPLMQPCTVDHMTALSADGSDWPWNLCLACRSCNSRKQAMSAGQFLALLLRESRLKVQQSSST